MPRCLAGSLCVVCLLSSGCFVAKDKPPTVDIGTEFATKFVHRGQTLVDNPVLHPSLAVGLPTTNGDSIGVLVDGNIDLRNDTGNAWFPDGHAGRFTQIEMIADYEHRFGDVVLRSGIHSYNLPNGLEFVNGERGGTSELFLLASFDVLETTPYLEWNYDFDEVKGSYIRAGVSEDFDLGGGFKLNLDGSLAYVTEAQAVWMYGLGQAGIADVRGKAVVSWKYDERTTLDFGLHGSLISDSTLDRWFSLLGIDSDPIWITIGVSWAF